jgi:excinuclease UvrABC nuclease subunit
MKKNFNRTNICAVPANRPILYQLDTAGGNPNYIGVAKRGRARNRLREHLPCGPSPIPAKTVKIRQFSSIAEAKAAEKRAIKSKQPKYNIMYK